MEERFQNEDKEKRMQALEELGILQVDDDGNWRYSNAFLTWIFPNE